ncbi:protein kinase [Nocardia sp. MDA0666]|uniref:protein kinase domain-containing protein n=1 Tax=Nocardia sp. MDA0666 TaxID=2135448 RepID=UPI000D1312EE|nr:protein kinase [Nocardia sp. MDA0666]PSR70238.1 protein kinase [Nocardia sp. MDA0666]
MVESDPSKTQRDDVDVVTELDAAGFADAKEIGRGGFGQVYRCTQLAVDRTVAVKVLTAELDENRERFLREQRAMGRLTGHPNIAGMLEVGETSAGRPYLVMPYYARGSLDARIRRDGPLPLPQVLRLGVKIAGALATAHRADVLHRDIKPSNILITDYDEPALTDFGIAHITGGFETSAGTITGSPAFTAPEVISAGAATRASDIYGLGATLFCALTGHAAFERRSGEQVVAQFLRITEQPVPDLRERGYPDDVCAVIEAAMSRGPSDRPTAEMIGEQLRRIEHDHGYTVDEIPLQQPSDAEHKPPPSPAENTAGNLPLELTSFVDRRIQVAEAKNILAGSRLVTLTGIGGVGKSRLALRVAHKLTPDFTDGVWLVELSELRDPALVAENVAATLGLQNRGAERTLDILIRYLSSKDLLLVLDNCEHVVDEATKLTESLLRTCPGVRIMATSREALGIGAESVYAVPPLGISDQAGRRAARDDAVTLFAERAATAVPGFAVTERNRSAVTRICARLDGLPLAIELAAARLRTLSLDQIDSRLDDRFALLTRGSRGAPKRQQTLQWCIAWSYDLCTRAEQRLWEQLSVFAGGFEFDAAEHVCGSDLDGAELLDAVAALVDKSILLRDEIDDRVRFRMLETVQQYGRQMAEAHGAYPEDARRQRNWCEQLARQVEEEWIGPHQLAWIARLERELPNLRRALEFSLSNSDESAVPITSTLYLFWLLGGRLSEGRRWLERELAQPIRFPQAYRAKALYAASTMAAMQADLPAAFDKIRKLESLAENTADRLSKALLVHAEGNICLTGGDVELQHGRDFLTEAVALYTELGELGLQLDAQISLGWCYALLGDSDRALPPLQEALAVTESAGEVMLRSWALWIAGFALWRKGDIDTARHMLRMGIQAARQVNDPLVAAVCSEILAWTAAQQHDYRRATVLMGAADTLGHAAGISPFILRDSQIYHEQAERACRTALGARAFDAARQEGTSMNFHTAAAFALNKNSPAAASATPPARLTRRERQVADLVAEGLTNRAIAARLVISQRTAEGHVEHILTKLGFTSRSQIAAWASGHSGP